MKLDRQKKIQPQDIICENSFSCRENSNGRLMACDFESLVRDTCADESSGSFTDYLGSLFQKNENSNLCPSQLEVSQKNVGDAAFTQLNKQIGTGGISLVKSCNDSTTICASNEDGPTSQSDQPSTGSQTKGIETTGADALPETPKHSVTIVPSTSDNGEVNYVIVVHPTVPNTGESPDASDIIQPPAPEEEFTATKKKIRKIPTYPVQKCDLCDYTNPFKALVNRHRKTHSEARPFTCPLCDKSFKDKRYYDYHKNAHTGTKPFACRLCSKSFATIGEQGRHMRYMHTGEKPHKCDRCDFRSVELHKLKRHIRRHLGENRFPCSKCPFTAADSFKLEYHMSLMHSDDCYCEECDLNFTMSGGLQDHKLDHIKGDPVFACALCPLTCAFKQTLTEHMQVLHKFGSPIICKDCDESFIDRNSYKIHRRNHGGHKFKCKLCPFKATYKSQINVHMYMHTDSFSSYERRRRLSDYQPIINKEPAEFKTNNNRMHAEYKPNKNRFQAEYKSNNRIQAEYKLNKSRIQAENQVKIPNTVLSTLAKQKKHECPTCEKEFKDFETLKKHFISHLISANRGIKMDKPKITVKDDKREKLVSLEDLDELSVFDALKSPVDISEVVPPVGLLPNMVPESMSVDVVTADGFSPDDISLDGLLKVNVRTDVTLSDSTCQDGVTPGGTLPNMVSAGMSVDSVPPVGFSPEEISLDGLLKVGVDPDGMCLDVESLDSFASNGLSTDNLPNTMPLDGVLSDGLSPDGVLPISMSLNGVLPDGPSSDSISPDGALPISMSLNGVLPDGPSSDSISPDGVLPISMSLNGVLPDGPSSDGISPDSVLPISMSLNGVLPNGLSSDGTSSDGVLPISLSLDGVLPVVLSSHGISPDSALPDGMSINNVLSDSLLANGLLSDSVLPDGVFSDGVLPIKVSLDDMLPDGELPESVLPDGVFPDGVLPIKVSLDGMLPDGELPESVLKDGVFPDGVLPIKVSLDGMLPDGELSEGVFPDGVLPVTISLDGVLPDGHSPDGVPPDGVLPGDVFPNGALPISALEDALPNGLSPEVISVESSSPESDVVYVDGLSPYNESSDFISPDKVPEIHIESNSKSNIAEDIVDQFEKMQEEYAKANNNNDQYAKDETVNIECDLISCLGLDELVENMDDDEDISLSSVF